MKNASVVAQRIAYEGIMKGGALKVGINQELMAYVRRSNGVQKAALEKEKLRQTQGEKRRAERKRLSSELKHAMTAKKRVLKNMISVVSEHDSNIHALEEKLRAT